MDVRSITNPTVLFCLHIGTEAERINYYVLYVLFIVLCIIRIMYFLTLGC